MSLWDRLADRDTPSRSRLVAALAAELRARLGEGARVLDSPSRRELYSRDLADLPRWLEKALFRTTPHLVVQPRDPRETASVLAFAAERRLPVVPRGLASSAYGGPVPTANGIVLDLSPMDGIHDVSPGPPPTATVQAGARFGDMEDRLAPLGYRLPVYPSNRLATVAGWISGGGLGINALKYGEAAGWVEAIQVATMDGALRWLRNGDADFDLFLGSEGQLGVIAEVALRLLPRAEVGVPHLLGFESVGAAMAFAGELHARGVRPATATFLSAELLRLVEQIHDLDHPADATPRPSSPQGKGRRGMGAWLLLHCDDLETERALGAVLAGRADVHQAERAAGGRLWADRYFPMKIQRLGPSMLAGQVVLPAARMPAFLERLDRTARAWGVTPAVEAHFLAGGGERGAESGEPERGEGGGSGDLHALAIAMFLSDRRRPAYLAHLLVASLVDRLGARFGGRPYNLGLWHAASAGERHSARRTERLARAKEALDPHHLLNPGKFPRVQSRFLGLPGLLLRPAPFRAGMDLLAAATPLIAAAMGRRNEHAGDGVQRHLEPAGGHRGRFHAEPDPVDFQADPSPELLATAARCTSCGNCVSVCPAYLHTRDERTTARAKLWLARRAASAGRTDPDEAKAAFLCMRCRACAEVCQTQLPLMEAWEQLEHLLAARHGRPDGEIRAFLAGVERNPDYERKIGLRRPGGILVQGWLAEGSPGVSGSGRPPVDPRRPPETRRDSFRPVTAPAPSRLPPAGRFRIERNDFCVNCGQCGEACMFRVHVRNPRDPRRMAAPADHLCVGCFRCLQDCPRQALQLSGNPAYVFLGFGPYTPAVVWALARFADEGRVPEPGSGYGGPFTGPGFDGMWTDVSEMVRPVRDGIGDREPISTAIDLGRRPDYLVLDERGRLARPLPPWRGVPLPILFQAPPLHADEPKVALALREAAVEVGTFVLGPSSPSDGVVQVDGSEGVEQAVAAIKVAAPGCLVVVRVPVGPTAPARAEDLAREGVEVIHLAAGWDGAGPDGGTLYESLPQVHARLAEAGLRDRVTLLASGGIAQAEHVPKAMVLGADGVVVDLPVLAALECPLGESCFRGEPCPTDLGDLDVDWGRQRIVNLMAAWHQQLLQIVGAMGLSDVRRLRGARDRAMFLKELERDLLAPA